VQINSESTELVRFFSAKQLHFFLEVGRRIFGLEKTPLTLFNIFFSDGWQFALFTLSRGLSWRDTYHKPATSFATNFLSASLLFFNFNGLLSARLDVGVSCMILSGAKNLVG